MFFDYFDGLWKDNQLDKKVTYRKNPTQYEFDRPESYKRAPRHLHINHENKGSIFFKVLHLLLSNFQETISKSHVKQFWLMSTGRDATTRVYILIDNSVHKEIFFGEEFFYSFLKNDMTSSIDYFQTRLSLYWCHNPL